MNDFTRNRPRRASLAEIQTEQQRARDLEPLPKPYLKALMEQQHARGLEPMPLDVDLLIKRIEQGGHSGRFLADAFVSAYRMTPFTHSLGELVKLDAEGFRLFHQVLHIRHIKGWSDSALYQIEQRIIAVMEGAK